MFIVCVCPSVCCTPPPSSVACLQDALADRDLVHRQTAATVVQHLALGVAGLSCEDALTHLLNFVWPNIFEDSPHLINGVIGAIDGCRLALGPCVVLHYTLQVGGSARPAGRLVCLCCVEATVYCAAAGLACKRRCFPRDMSRYRCVQALSGADCVSCCELAAAASPAAPTDSRRACSIPRARCGRRTGRFTTTCTSGHRTRWLPSCPASPTPRTAQTPMCGTSWRSCCEEGVLAAVKCAALCTDTALSVCVCVCSVWFCRSCGTASPV